LQTCFADGLGVQKRKWIKDRGDFAWNFLTEQDERHVIRPMASIFTFGMEGHPASFVMGKSTPSKGEFSAGSKTAGFMIEGMRLRCSQRMPSADL
jgi:hypothetical protein